MNDIKKILNNLLTNSEYDNDTLLEIYFGNFDDHGGKLINSIDVIEEIQIYLKKKCNVINYDYYYYLFFNREQYIFINDNGNVRSKKTYFKHINFAKIIDNICINYYKSDLISNLEFPIILKYNISAYRKIKKYK